MTKIKIGFLGCGRISQKHFEAILKFPNEIEVVAVCDGTLEKAKKAAEHFGCKYFDNIDEFVSTIDANIIVIATPNGLHPEHAVLCAKHGMDVLCEKPMSVSEEGAQLILSEFKKLGRNFFLIHQNRYNDPVMYIKKAIDEGRFGKIYLLSSNVFWQRPQEYYDKEPWHGTRKLDGGAFMTQASHYVDMLNWFANSPVQTVFSMLATLGRKIETEDTGIATIKWKNGVIGNLNVTVLTYPKNIEGSITIIGEKGTAKIGGVAMNEISHLDLLNPSPEDNKIMNLNYQTDSVYGFGHQRVYERIISFYNSKNAMGLIGMNEAYSSFQILHAIITSNETNQPVSF